MAWLEPITLTGTRVTLEPLSFDHHDGLVAALKDGEMWNLWYTSIPSPDRLRAEIERRPDYADDDEGKFCVMGRGFHTSITS